MANSGDVSAFKLLLSLAIIYGLMSILVHSVIHMKFIKPLGIDAPLDRFSEGRAVEHVRVLSKEIDGRQVGRQGLDEAARYIKTQLEMLKARAGSNVRIEIEEEFVSGSFNMMFLGHSLSLGYKNHTNIVMRISSVDSRETDPSVLLNGHFDSAPGSPGASDCGSCVASLLEIARLTIDSGWAPPQPVIFLFNGAEELFMLGSHGFMTTHKWRDTIGAFINFEATGTGGLDVVCQSGPGPLPSLVYAQSALYPMGNSAAQDVFGIAPGDTDYRIFASDHGNIPGLDIIFLLGGYFYHTASDTVERLLPGSIQARGDNLISILKAFTNSSKLQSAQERVSLGAAVNGSNPDDERPVYFDYLSWFLIFYTRRQAMVLHSIPIAIFLLMPFLLRFPTGFFCSFMTFFDFMKGMLFHFCGIILAIIFPVVFAILILLFPGHSMNWFANPYLAFMMFVPSSLAGLLTPRIVWRCFPLSQDFSLLKSSKEELANTARFWGAFGFYAILTFAYLLAGLGGGFVAFFLSAFMLPAWFSFCMSVKSFGRQSLRSAACFVIPLMPWLVYSIYFCAILAQFLIEKMGMTGSLPPPYGYFIPDILVAATIGVVTGLCVGPLVPVVGNWLARSSIMQFLLHITVLALALSSQFFPYSNDAPKRVVFQHTVLTADGQIVDSSFDLSVLDSNSLRFLFKHVPEVARELQIGSDFSFDTSNPSHRESWMAIYPLSSLFSRSLKFPAKRDEILMHYRYFPHLSTYRPQTISDLGSRRIYLEFSLGSLEEVWVAVLNITGPLSNWSLANNILPAPENVGGGPPSYICRLSGAGHENWTFWLEASSSEDIRVEVGVVDQYLLESAKKLKGLFPNWVDVTAYTSYLSSYIL
ncbi:hypothetical protein LguiB_024635 [Lonicera macranthoides]